MVQTWTTSKEDDLPCAKCGSVYSVTVTRYPSRDRGEFKCEVCQTLLKAWNGTHDYSFTLKLRGRRPD